MGDIKTAKHAARAKQGGAKHAKPVDHSGRYRKLFAVLGASVSVVIGISGYFGIQAVAGGEDVLANALPAGAYATKSVEVDSATPEVGDADSRESAQALSESPDSPTTNQGQLPDNAKPGLQDNLQGGSPSSQSAEPAEARSEASSATDEEAQGSQPGDEGVGAQQNADAENPDEAESRIAESGAQDTGSADDGGANADGSAKEAEAAEAAAREAEKAKAAEEAKAAKAAAEA